MHKLNLSQFKEQNFEIVTTETLKHIIGGTKKLKIVDPVIVDPDYYGKDEKEGTQEKTDINLLNLQ